MSSPHNGNNLQSVSPLSDYARNKDIPIEKYQSLFEKKFQYKKTTNWKLPPVEELFKEFYQFDNLQKLKQELNAVKGKLNDYVLEDWSVHTKKRDPSKEIPWRIKTDFEGEFVTVAWCKLFECLHQYKMVKDGKFNSLHLCEAPGAFIAALNHYLHSTYDNDEIDWKWLSTTFNPYYEGNPLNKMIIDDRFMLHTLDRWIFHEDFSGNIIDRKNIQHMAKMCRDRLGDVHFITADGSIDCIETPDNQEELVSTLHFAEVCAALLILAKGGNFLLKMFTLFEAPSVNLVYFLNCLFEEVNVFKPATSKRGNSELYLICLNYSKPSNIEDYLNAMMDKINTDTQNIFPLFPKRYIPVDFCIQHEVCTRKFKFEQTEAIESNIYSYENNSKWENKLCNELRSQVTKFYFQRYNVRPIAPEQKILQNPLSKIQYGIQIRLYRGSHNNRMCIKNLPIDDQLFHLRKELNEIDKAFMWQYDEIACLKQSPEEQLPLKVFRGKPVQDLKSSLFSAIEILLLRQRFTTILKVDPFIQGNPVCILGTAENPELWSINLDCSQNKFECKRQRDFFTEILKNIIDNQPTTIKFKNVPFLTHYSVSILRYLTANMYELCRITGDPEITLESSQISKKSIQTVKELYETLIVNPDVLCFVDILHLHRNQFFKAICDYNNQLLINNFKMILEAE